MDYIYDIVLNFQDKYYDFYEWLPTDKIINIKRLPIYKITNKNYLAIKNNEVIIDRTTLPKQNKMFLITSGLEVIGIYIDNNGRVIKKSSLIFEENDDILKDKDEIKKINIKYHIASKNKILTISRLAYQKYKYVINYLTKLDKEKDEYLLKYLYYEIYNEIELNTSVIYDRLLKLSKQDINLLYKSISEVTMN